MSGGYTAELVLTYRTSALTEQSARIALRLPGYERSEIEYRPLVPGYPWRSSIPFNLESTRDWTAEVSLEHLQPGVQYECEFWTSFDLTDGRPYRRLGGAAQLYDFP
jgi:hypothetical protein